MLIWFNDIDERMDVATVGVGRHQCCPVQHVVAAMCWAKRRSESQVAIASGYQAGKSSQLPNQQTRYKTLIQESALELKIIRGKRL
jgi:hypothetical protein